MLYQEFVQKTNNNNNNVNQIIYLIHHDRDLYGREDSVYLLNHDRGSLSDPGTKLGVKWDLPEGQIILIKNSATINGISSLRKAGKSYLEIRIKPRLLNAGKGNCEWIIHRI